MMAQSSKNKYIRHPIGNQTSKGIEEKALSVARIRNITLISTQSIQLVSIAKYSIPYSAQFLLAINICPGGIFRAFLCYWYNSNTTRLLRQEGACS